MKDARGRIVYVGKAKNLSNRLHQWFVQKPPTVWGELMLEKVVTFDYLLTDNEIEALALECSLIKQEKPPYNVMLTDDKQYPYLRIDVGSPFPMLRVVRKIEKDGALYFGPYPDVGSMRGTIRLIHRLFKFRPCRKDLSKLRADASWRPCLYFHIGQCLGPCRPEVSQAENKAISDKVVDFLQGRHEQLAKRLEKEMKAASAELDFEKAASLRDQFRDVTVLLGEQKLVSTRLHEADLITLLPGEPALLLLLFFRFGKLVGQDDFHLAGSQDRPVEEILTEFIKQRYASVAYVPELLLLETEPQETELLAEWLSGLRGSKVELVVPKRGERRKLMDLAARNLEELRAREQYRKSIEKEQADLALGRLQNLLGLPARPSRIETYDVSNTSGTNATGSMIVFEEGLPAKSQYRKFNLRGDYPKPNDYAMMEELLGRRFRLSGQDDESFRRRPDLVLIDGGKGHLKVAVEVLGALGLNEIPIASLAKQEEQVFIPGRKTPVALEEGEPAHFLVQRMRDEAHRFAITQHRSVRTRTSLQAELESIEGMGRIRLRKLLAHFGTIETVASASVMDLARAPGMTRPVAERLFLHFHPEEEPDAPTDRPDGDGPEAAEDA